MFPPMSDLCLLFQVQMRPGVTACSLAVAWSLPSNSKPNTNNITAMMMWYSSDPCRKIPPVQEGQRSAIRTQGHFTGPPNLCPPVEQRCASHHQNCVYFQHHLKPVPTAAVSERRLTHCNQPLQEGAAHFNPWNILFRIKCASDTPPLHISYTSSSSHLKPLNIIRLLLLLANNQRFSALLKSTSVGLLNGYLLLPK